MLGRVASGFLMLATGSAALADSPFTRGGETDDADTILPITSYPLGQSNLVAMSMARQLRMNWIEKELCDQVGCLVVRNDTKIYKVAEVRIALLGKDGTSRWSRNQLVRPLLPKDKLVQLKIAPAASCNRDIMVVLQHRKTKEKLVMESTTNLCPTPNIDSLIRIEVKKPEVIVQDAPQ